MITVGLDFGTHQTKVCVEQTDGIELKYEFLKFKDTKGVEQYVLPSIICVNKDSTLSYGYILKPKEKSKLSRVYNSWTKIIKTNKKQENNNQLEIIRYFKQAAFTQNNQLSQQDGIFYSIWYIAYVLFLLKSKYGNDFSIQMGVPTDGKHLNDQKKLATRILLSAYDLVENKLNNDKDKFLSMTLFELKGITNFLEYDEGKKYEYGILVFPEAYACLMPLTTSNRISNGMSLMIDIGGGTTDISFFTIRNDKPQVYDFYSINKGLNFLVDTENLDKNRLDSNLSLSTQIMDDRKNDFKNEIIKLLENLIGRLQKEFRIQSRLQMVKLFDALESRPIVYTGGGSTFKTLRMDYEHFSDVKHISTADWKQKNVVDIDKIKEKGLSPILSTAYGLSISVVDDNIETFPFEDIFVGLRQTLDHDMINQGGQANDGFDYGLFEG
ncbi:MAG: hypothetical protein IKV26_01860 [Paludibacteraceae bacterium]|nr:hypothetical protein [Paludibacteraceae bacterium]